MLKGILGILEQFVTFQVSRIPLFYANTGSLQRLWLQPPSVCETPNAVLESLFENRELCRGEGLHSPHSPVSASISSQSVDKVSLHQSPNF